MEWVKYLKRGSAVVLTAALLAGGVNWYSLRLKAVSSSEQEELAALDDQDGQNEAGGGTGYPDRRQQSAG